MIKDINDTVIIGSGPAGCTAAIYAARANLNPVLIAGPEPGGQLTTTPEIGNWPGASDNPNGFDLMQTLQNHAKSLGTEFISDIVKETSLKGDVKELTLNSGKVIKARTVIIATGAAAKYLGIESEQQYKGKGVSACATCDGFFFRNKDVAVIGGGSAAFVEALYLSNICSKVYLVHRREGFRAEQIMIDRLREKEKEGKVEFVLNATVDSIDGDGSVVTGITLNQQGRKVSLNLSGVFVSIGHAPATSVFADLEKDAQGYITVGHGTETQTSVKGVYAAGDCCDHEYRQAITSAGQGCKAALDAERYIGSLE
ncbi:MAG: thioredoxin-disulfide reductase [Succinivibrio sp.]|nr:thioredoxin-disulfide reductase [Succinivibrio sp.]